MGGHQGALGGSQKIYNNVNETVFWLITVTYDVRVGTLYQGDLLLKLD